jgi:vacuolar-type H+-ATPase subunit H
MSERKQAEELALQAADAVRRTVAEAEERAEQIVREAEAEAKRIRDEGEADAQRTREKARADARERIERARRALSELAGETPQPVPAPDPQPAPPPEPEPEPEPQPQPVPTPDPEEPTAGGANGDDAAARLVAMKLAVEGKGREEIEAELIQRFGPGDRSGLLEDVLARAGR